MHVDHLSLVSRSIVLPWVITENAHERMFLDHRVTTGSLMI